MLKNKEVDGIIFLTTAMADDELNELSLCYPVIQCGAIASGSNISYVCIDDVSAAYDGVAFLHRLGHEKISFINYESEKDLPFIRLRHKGYINALRDHAIPIVPDYEKACDNNYTSSYQIMDELMQLSEKPTAIFTFSEQTAIGILRYMYDHQMTPGKDIDILAFDGTFLSECTFPALSVVQQPAYELGRTAFNMLNERISDPTTIPMKTILAHKIIARGTTRNL